MIPYFEWLLLVFPLLGLLVNGFFGGRMGRRWPGIIASAMVLCSFVVAVVLAIGLVPAYGQPWPWIKVGSFEVKLSLLIDPLSLVMTLVVTGVGFLIHVYSIGYMHEDERVGRFFTLLNLFIFSMLILVLADNFLLLYVGWELAGLCSYLLIGFWFERPAAADASKKAFLVTRVADFGFALGVMLIFATFGTLDFAQVFEMAPQTFATLGGGVFTAITLLLSVGATGKSAQIPLYVWLPDAMGGPTPASAFGYAATMITVGVYMVARCFTLFSLAPGTMQLVAWIGGLTAFFAATIALVQTDLKRILAYSTISQLGYMFMAVGVGAWGAGVFHLTTHAFFKSLLFLGAGAVMHALSGELNIFKMGALREKLKLTYLTFLAGAAALAGFPLLSGFFSKDEILWNVFQSSPLLWGLGLVTAFMTAFYAFRAVFVPFWGKSRLSRKAKAHLHKPTAVMTVPLIVLAVLALVGGLIGLPHLSAIEGYLEPVFHNEALAEVVGEPTHAAGVLEWVLLGASALVALLGIGLAWMFYVRDPGLPARLSKRLGWLYRLLANKYHVDEIYTLLIVEPLRGLGRWLGDTLDPKVLDGAVNGVAALLGLGGRGVGRLQTGYVRNYALAILLGAVCVVGYFVIRAAMG